VAARAVSFEGKTVKLLPVARWNLDAERWELVIRRQCSLTGLERPPIFLTKAPLPPPVLKVIE
jgi:hypothetical protein